MWWAIQPFLPVLLFSYIIPLGFRGFLQSSPTYLFPPSELDQCRFLSSMCQQISEGTRWDKCGHFQRHMVVAILDCNSQRCRKSVYHPTSCRLPTCINIFDTEIQRDVDKVDEFCFACRAAQARAAGVRLT